MTGDPGAVLLREVAERSGTVSWATARLSDPRSKLCVTHDLAWLIRTGVLLSAQGWRCHDDGRRFLRDLHMVCPIRIIKILTDRGKELTDRPFASRARAASGSLDFYEPCTKLGIEHRLTPPKSSQTNGMGDRLNWRIAEVPRTNRFDRALDMEQTLIGCVASHNTQLQ